MYIGLTIFFLVFKFYFLSEVESVKLDVVVIFGEGGQKKSTFFNNS